MTESRLAAASEHPSNDNALTEEQLALVTGGESWYEALAKALGEVAAKKR